MNYNEDYFHINEAAKKLNVSNLDLIRYAANGKVSLCVVSGLLRYTLNFWFDNSSDFDDFDSLKIHGTTEFEFDGLVSLNQSDCRLIQQKGYIDNSIEVDRFDKLINFDIREEALLALITEDERVIDKLIKYKNEEIIFKYFKYDLVLGRFRGAGEFMDAFNVNGNNLYILTADIEKLRNEIPQKQASKPTKTDRNTLLKIIKSIAINGYKYPSHSSITEIKKDMEKSGIDIDMKTLREKLMEANKL